ncbi:MAG: transposase [Chloroflexota bacterium]
MNLYYKYIDPIAETFAYCLLRNHFHVSLKTKTEEEIIETLRVSKSKDPKGLLRPLGSDGLGSGYLSKKFSDFFNAYAKAINKAYDRTGSLFQHPFGRVPITTDRQFWNVIAYIHQNPQKHKFVKDFRDWKWSSYGILLAEKPTKLKRDIVLDWFGGKESYLDLHQQWVSDADAKWFAEDDYD